MTAKRAARALADLHEGTILAVVEIDAAPERVFRALTEDVSAWWGSPETYQVTEWEADLRVGGAWRSTGRGADGKPFAVTGEFLEIDPPRRLVQTWRAPWDGGNVTTIRYHLEPIPAGTRVTLRHEGFAGRPASCDGHAAGWERVLGWLGQHLEPRADRYFLCRLLPPRSTFMQDMTQAEGKVMQEHAAYWKALMEDGKAIVFGPVADPKGGWGVGVVCVKDEAEMTELRSKDPSILSGLGFAYEVLPMLRAVTRA